MGFNMTPAQRNAVETRDKSILLSAAAGSGKTAALTARIIGSLTAADDPADLSRMLVVTFTRAAASELRERISKALGDALAADPLNEHLLRQSVLIGSADICTIDSFCLDLVKAYFQRLTLDGGTPLPPDFRLADETELSALKLDVMNSVIDSMYDSCDPSVNFSRFAENFSGTRDEGKFIDILIDYAEDLENVTSPDTYTDDAVKEYRNSAELDFFDTVYGKRLKTSLSEKLSYFESICATACRELDDGGVCAKNYLPAFASDLDFCRSLKAAVAEGYEKASAVAGTYAAMGLKSLGKHADETTKAYQKLRETYKKELSGMKEKYFCLTPAEISALALRTAEELSVLSAVISEYRRRYAKEKILRRILEFSDIKRLAHTLLVKKDGTPTETALELRQKYDAVYIDEYQDVDPVQDEIFRAVSKEGCRFSVGDIKQSIYGFRGAEPAVFGSMRDSMPDFGSPDAEERRECAIYMSENFRCDGPVIDFVNAVSRSTFMLAGGVVGYRREDDLIHGRSDADSEKVRLSLFCSGAGEATRPEVAYIVSEIAALVADGRKDDGTPIGYSDIAVLSRSSNFSSLVEEALSAAGIPSENSAAKDFFANPEILLVFSLLAAIDNPQKDIMLAAALRSPFFGFTMDELVRIRAASDISYSLFDATEEYAAIDLADGELKEKCADFLALFDSLREESRSSPVDRFVRDIFEKFSVMSLSDDNSGRTAEQIHANLVRFSDYALRYAKTRTDGLTGFVNYISSIIESGETVDSPSVPSAVGAVKIMTIHKSKGLEFPVVFLVGCGVRFNRDDLNSTLLSDTGTGIALKLTDDTGFARTDTPHRLALTVSIREKQTEEQMRVLYVALTRARERLYVTGSVGGKDPEGALMLAKSRARFACRSSVMAANCYLDWLLPAAVYAGDCLELSVFPDGAELPNTAEDHQESPETAENSSEISEARYRKIKERLSEMFGYSYPHAEAVRIPAKLSVSRLYPDLLDEGTAEPASDRLPAPERKPLFMMAEVDRRASAAEKGTATHLFLQFCDFERAKRSVTEELSRLVTERFIPAGSAALVNIRQLERFFSSSFFAKIEGSKKLWRETRFNLLLPAAEFTSDSAVADALKGEEILVQGVIDLLFIDRDGRIVLCDYKTDYVPKEFAGDDEKSRRFFLDRHGEQLSYYKKAAEKLLSAGPDGVCIYSLFLGEEFYLDI